MAKMFSASKYTKCSSGQHVAHVQRVLKEFSLSAKKVLDNLSIIVIQ